MEKEKKKEDTRLSNTIGGRKLIKDEEEFKRK